MILQDVAGNARLLEIGRRAVEDRLIEFRDNRIATMNRGNGLVIREPDGTNSHVIRMGIEVALKIALEAISEHLEQGKTVNLYLI